MKADKIRAAWLTGQDGSIADTVNAWLEEHKECDVMEIKVVEQSAGDPGVFIIYREERSSGRPVGFASPAQPRGETSP